MRIYFKNSTRDSDKRVWSLIAEKNRLRDIPYESITKAEKARFLRIKKILADYECHYPTSESAIAQWEKELPYTWSTYHELMKGMIKMAKICNKMQSKALSKIKAC